MAVTMPDTWAAVRFEGTPGDVDDRLLAQVETSIEDAHNIRLRGDAGWRAPGPHECRLIADGLDTAALALGRIAATANRRHDADATPTSRYAWLEPVRTPHGTRPDPRTYPIAFRWNDRDPSETDAANRVTVSAHPAEARFMRTAVEALAYTLRLHADETEGRR